MEQEDVLIRKDNEKLTITKIDKGHEVDKNHRQVFRTVNVTVVPPNYTGFIKCRGQKVAEIFVEECVRMKECSESYVPNYVL